MATAFTVPLSKVMKEFSLEVISLDGNPDEILISSMEDVYKRQCQVRPPEWWTVKTPSLFST